MKKKLIFAIASIIVAYGIGEVVGGAKVACKIAFNEATKTEP